MLGYLSVPLAISMVSQQTQYITLKRVCRFGFYFWLIQVLFGLWSLTIGEEVIGFTGNRNWAASLLLALVPWSYSHVKILLSRCMRQQRHAKEPSILSLGSGLIVGVPTAYSAYHCASRGAWLALGVFMTLLLIRYIVHNFRTIPHFFFGMNRLEKIFSCIVLVLSLMAVIAYTKLAIMYLSSPKAIIDLERVVSLDVRLPLWASTFAMTRDNDIFLSRVLKKKPQPGEEEVPETNPLGIGPGRYTKIFSDYRRRSTYHDRLVTAAITIHPHNEFLSIAAQLGVLSAFVWLITLYPLIRLNRTEDNLMEYARYSAFVIYFHGFFDMTLAQSPGNLVGFFCLGLCWRRCLAKPSPESTRGYESYLQRSLVSLALLTLVCGGAYTTFKDLRTDWYLRRGMIEQKMGKYRQSFDSYKSAMASDPQNIHGYVSAASVALDNLKDPATGLSILLKAQEMDRNFGHINGQLGQAFGQLGYRQDALAYLSRECKLYPGDPKAFQNYFNGLVFNNEFDRLNDVSRYLQRLYYNKVRLKYGTQEITELINSWVEAVETGELTAALRAAEKICYPINQTFLDPLTYIVTPDSEWPNDLLTGHFNYLDYMYWRQLLWLKKLSMSVIGNGGTGDSAIDLAKRLRSFFRQHVVVDSSVERFEFPHEVWKKKSGTPMSCLFLFAQLASQSGFVPVLYVGKGDDQAGHCVLIRDGHLYAVSPFDDSPVTEIVHLNSPHGTVQSARFDANWKAAYFPQGFWLRNQILGTIVRQFGQNTFPVFDGVPIVQVWDTLQFSGQALENITFVDLKKYCLLEPSVVLLEKLSR